jgi:hypothetical protein
MLMQNELIEGTRSYFGNICDGQVIIEGIMVNVRSDIELNSTSRNAVMIYGWADG